jgi:tRNA A37 N6-isopentenylltransferase MiaA
MRKAMTAAGRGEVLSYRNFPEVVEKEESDYITQCNRCGKTLDTRTAKNQMEWFRAGALKARVPTYYCNDCYNLLSQIGAGEYTELDERAGRKPSYEPEYKGDE